MKPYVSMWTTSSCPQYRNPHRDTATMFCEAAKSKGSNNPARSRGQARKPSKAAKAELLRRQVCVCVCAHVCHACRRDTGILVSFSMHGDNCRRTVAMGVEQSCSALTQEVQGTSIHRNLQ